jgi:hypothetical protein
MSAFYRKQRVLNIVRYASVLPALMVWFAIWRMKYGKGGHF